MKDLKLIFTIVCLTGLLFRVDAQAQKQEDLMAQLLGNSHPGKYHAVLGQLAGTWDFQDTKLSFVKGKLIRKAIYDGRFYTVEMTGGKLQLPVADGKMEEGNYESLQLEGYDNVKSKFISTSINNHIGSDMQFQTGHYDPVKKELTYDWESELIKGKIIRNRRIISLTDASHYRESFYEWQGKQYVKVRELVYTKSE